MGCTAKGCERLGRDVGHAVADRLFGERGRQVDRQRPGPEQPLVVRRSVGVEEGPAGRSRERDEADGQVHRRVAQPGVAPVDDADLHYGPAGQLAELLGDHASGERRVDGDVRGPARAGGAGLRHELLAGQTRVPRRDEMSALLAATGRGPGRPTRNPWTASAPIAVQVVRSLTSSTPSTMSWAPVRWANSMSARARARRSGLVPTPWVREMSSLMVSGASCTMCRRLETVSYTH